MVVAEIVSKRMKHCSYGLLPPTSQARTIELMSAITQPSIDASMQDIVAVSNTKSDKSLTQTDIRTANNVTL